MFRKIILVMVCLLCCMSVYSQQLNEYDFIEVEMENTVSFEVEFSNNYKINSLYLNNYFFPQTYNESQNINDFTSTNSNYQIIEEVDNKYLRYDFKETLEEKNTITNSFDIQSKVDRPKISQEVPYPPEKIKQDYQKYLKFSGLITIDENIREKATQLAQGETDSYVIASKVAKWVRGDINYDLSTITEDPDQTSSEVFQSKAGVCKEITHLYISMMRSLGIPARVVTGYAYTTSQSVIDYVGSPWGGHAWAEVLIGDKWVPFDLTYNQYGFVDSTHIVLDKSANIRESSVSVNGTGQGFSFVDNSLTLDNSFSVSHKQKDLFERGFSIETKGSKEVAPKSYGYINTTVTNSKDFYQVLFLNIAKTNSMELLTDQQKMLIFKPGETKEFLTKFKAPNLDRRYASVKHPFSFYNNFIEESFSVTITPDGQNLSEEELPQEKEEKITFSNKKIQLSCDGSFQIPNNKIMCGIKNPNNYEIKGSKLCVNTQCEELDFLINEEKNVNFTSPHFSPVAIFSYGDEVIKEEISIEKPKLQHNIELNKDSLSIKANHSNENSLIFELSVDNKLVETINGDSVDFSKTLKPGNHTLTIMLKDNQRTFDTYSAKVVVEQESFFTKIMNFFKNLF